MQVDAKNKGTKYSDILSDILHSKAQCVAIRSMTMKRTTDSECSWCKYIRCMDKIQVTRENAKFKNRIVLSYMGIDHYDSPPDTNGVNTE